MRQLPGAAIDAAHCRLIDSNWCERQLIDVWVGIPIANAETPLDHKAKELPDRHDSVYFELRRWRLDLAGKNIGTLLDYRPIRRRDLGPTRTLRQWPAWHQTVETNRKTRTQWYNCCRLLNRNYFSDTGVFLYLSAMQVNAERKQYNI